MRKTGLFLQVVSALAVVCLYATSAEAQATRTWVSGVGDDANPCSRTAPCKTFAGAISKTSVAGEIDVLDPGGFGALTITKSISIIAAGVEAGVLVSGTNGFVINVQPTDSVVIEGLDFEGLNTGLDGIKIVGSGRTVIRKCTFRNFTGNGALNSGNGVNVVGAANARVIIADSVFIHNTGGVNVSGNAPGVFNFAAVQNSLIDNNSSYATQVTGPSVLQLSTTTLSGSPASIINNNNASVISYGNNIIRNAGLPTQTLILQ